MKRPRLGKVRVMDARGIGISMYDVQVYHGGEWHTVRTVLDLPVARKARASLQATINAVIRESTK